jgi:hypothetical protein
MNRAQQVIHRNRMAVSVAEKIYDEGITDRDILYTICDRLKNREDLSDDDVRIISKKARTTIRAWRWLGYRPIVNV